MDGQAEGWMDIYVHIWNDRASLVAQSVKNLPAVQETGFDPWVRKIPGGGHGNPLQYSGRENPMDRGAWRATVHEVTQSQTRLSGFTFTSFVEWQRHTSTHTHTQTRRPLKEAEWETH